MVVVRTDCVPRCVHVRVYVCQCVCVVRGVRCKSVTVVCFSVPDGQDNGRRLDHQCGQ